MTWKKRENMGRQRIRMAKIEKETHRQVTFWKRRAGLFKKASELCTLCNVEMAIIVFSPAKKPFSFGHPNVHSVLDRYRKHASFAPQTQLQEKIAAAGSELSLVLTQMEEEKKKKGDAMRKAVEMVKWSVEEMSLLQLQQMKSALEKVRNIMVVAPSYKDMSSGFLMFLTISAMDQWSF